MRTVKQHRKSIRALLTIVLILGMLPALPLAAQQDVSGFNQAFQVFQQARDAYRTFNISPEDVVYPLPPTYTMGPGDILQVILTGMISDSVVVQVGPQGNIFVPPAGLLQVQGMTIEDATNYINSELSKYLINYDLSLQLLRARHISIYLLGQVRQPGTYVAIAGTTALSLIQTAGTLVTNPVTTNINEPQVMHPYFRALTSGAGRRVEVWRNNEKVGELDLARMAIGGHSGEDIILQDGDALFVPQNSRPVIVRGGVARPGTYEIADGETVLDLIAQAGGYRSMMMLAPVQVERPSPTGSPAAASNINLDLGNPSFDPASFTFQPGDILRVTEVKNQVYVLGAVWAPKAIDYHEGWNALDYIAATGGLVMPTDMTAIRIISFPLTEDQTELRFNFKNLVMGRPVETIPIEPGDLIFVPWKNQPFYGVGITNAIGVILGQASGIARLIHDLQD